MQSRSVAAVRADLRFDSGQVVHTAFPDMLLHRMKQRLDTVHVDAMRDVHLHRAELQLLQFAEALIGLPAALPSDGCDCSNQIRLGVGHALSSLWIGRRKVGQDWPIGETRTQVPPGVLDKRDPQALQHAPTSATALAYAKAGLQDATHQARRLGLLEGLADG